MLFNNVKEINGIFIPSYLKDKLSVCSNCFLRDDDVFLFNTAIQCVSEELIFDLAEGNLADSDVRNINIIFTENGEVSFSGISKEIATYFSVIIYKTSPLHYLENQRFTLFTMIEELTHHFWNIEDETEVKYKVLQIMKRYDKDITMDIVKGWRINGLS